MQLEFKSTPLTYLNSRLRQVQNQEQTLELRLTEGMPDIGRILLTGGQARLSSKQWRADSVSISGGIQAWALYLPEDGSQPQLVEGWIPLQAKFPLPEGCREGILDGRITVRNLDGRALSPRKLLLRCSVAMVAEALCPEETAIYSPEEVPEGVHILCNSYPVRLCREAGEKVFSLEDTLYADGMMPARLLYCRLMPKIAEQAVTGNRLMMRGMVSVGYLGEDAEGKLSGGNLELPFAQLVELEGEYDKEATAGVNLSLASCDWQMEGEGLRVRCEIIAQYRIHGVCLVKLAEDAYSSTMELEPQLEMPELPILLESRREEAEISRTIQVPAMQVMDVAFLPDEPLSYREGDQLVAELPGQIQMLYLDERQSLQAVAEAWCYRWELPAGDSCGLRLCAVPDGMPRVHTQGDQVRLECDLMLEAETWTRQKMPMLTMLQLGKIKEPDPCRPSVILRRAGQNTLWELAKSNGSTVEAIRQANQLTGEPDPKHMLLIPVL